MTAHSDAAQDGSDRGFTAAEPASDAPLHRYAMHGLVVASEFPLRGAPAAGRPDVLVVRRRERIADAGELVLDDGGDGAGQRAWRTEAGDWSIDVAGRWQLVIDAAATTLGVWSAADVGTGDVLAEGLGLAFVLHIRGRPTLHANAVCVDGRALLCCGVSGQGKSTLAAVLAAAGGEAIADDTVAVDILSDSVLAHPGSGGIRLRPTALPLLRVGGLGEQHATPDGRILVARPSTPASAPSPVRAILVPHLDTAAGGPRLDRLAGAEALVALVRGLRLVGWRNGAERDAAFRLAATLAQRLPPYRVTLPAGPAQTSDLAVRLRQLLATLS